MVNDKPIAVISSGEKVSDARHIECRRVRTCAVAVKKRDGLRRVEMYFLKRLQIQRLAVSIDHSIFCGPRHFALVTSQKACD